MMRFTRHHRRDACATLFLVVFILLIGSTASAQNIKTLSQGAQESQTYAKDKKFLGTVTIESVMPEVFLNDTTAGAKSAVIRVDGDKLYIQEKNGANGSLLTLDLANNRFGLGLSNPLSLVHLKGSPLTLTLTNTNGTASNRESYIKLLDGTNGNAQLAFGRLIGGTDVGGYLSIHTQNISGTLLERLRVDENGNLGLNETNPGAQFQVNASSATTIGQIIKGAASQTADLLQIQDSTGAVLTNFTSDGKIVAPLGSSTAPTYTFSGHTTRAGMYYYQTGAWNGVEVAETLRIGNTGGDQTNPVLVISQSTTTSGFFAPTRDEIAVTISGVEALRIDSGRNLGIGTTTFGTSAAGVIGLANGTAPTTFPANMVQIVAKDFSASSELYVYDEAGNETQLSPHDPETGEWIFNSTNNKTGKHVLARMEKAMKILQKLCKINGLGAECDDIIKEWTEN